MALNRFFIIKAHIFRAALNFAISSMKPLWALKKKEILWPNLLGSKPFAIAASMYAMPFANVNASSCSTVLPASLIW